MGSACENLALRYDSFSDSFLRPLNLDTPVEMARRSKHTLACLKFANLVALICQVGALLGFIIELRAGPSYDPNQNSITAPENYLALVR